MPQGGLLEIYSLSQLEYISYMSSRFHEALGYRNIKQYTGR